MPDRRPPLRQTAPARLALFGAVLAVAFGGSWALGSAVGPDADVASDHHAPAHRPGPVR